MTQVCEIKGSCDDGILRLNVGGKQFLTSRQTIMRQQNSMLASMFKAPNGFNSATDSDGFAFIDRDGERFHHVLNFLRCSSLPSFSEAWRYEEIMEEADFFAIDELAQLCEHKIEQLKQSEQREQAKPIKLRVTVVGQQPREITLQAGPKEPQGIGLFTLDEDF
ncbi:unnamed protein product [Choristocarpus tenellus]